ncbi:hypothetical protein CEXT_518071 [Caerostris extrusa]|uniref:Uncharacterized protein n=1 Tax=Caerostris extrusa TaxID=172846 RepID=A0AAV4XBA4_CAEEX|nr:hypothetical protein CEXT_518071 [Caerostris extrusa]
MQPPPPQQPFVIPKELLQETDALHEEISSPLPSRMNINAKYIAYTVPKTRKNPKLSEVSSPRTSVSKPKKRTTSERSRTLSSRESSPDMSEIQPIKWTSWRD